jgi:hypothetical protein
MIGNARSWKKGGDGFEKSLEKKGVLPYDK